MGVADLFPGGEKELDALLQAPLPPKAEPIAPAPAAPAPAAPTAPARKQPRDLGTQPLLERIAKAPDKRDEIISVHAQERGLTPEMYRREAARQGVALDPMIEEVVKYKKPAAQVAKEAEQRKAFAPVHARGAYIRGEAQRKISERAAAGRARPGEAELAHKLEVPAVTFQTVEGETAQVMPTEPRERPELPLEGEEGFELTRAYLQSRHEATNGQSSQLMDMLGDKDTGFPRYVREIAGRDVATQERRARALGLSIDHDKIAKEAIERAVGDVAAAKATGLWVAPAYLPASWDVLQAAPESRKFQGFGGRLAYLFRSAVEAGKPTVEVVGGVARQDGGVSVITRPVSALGYSLDLFDLPGSYFTGIAGSVGDIAENVGEARKRGEVGVKEAWLSTAEAGVRGMAERRNPLEAIMGTEAAHEKTRAPTREEIRQALVLGEEPDAVVREERWRPWLAMGVGLVAAVGMPDALVGAGLANDIRKAARVGIVSRADAVRAVDLLGGVATGKVKGEQASQAWLKALASGDAASEEAAFKAVEAALGEAEAAEIKLRGSHTPLARTLDRTDAAVARHLSEALPGVADVELARSLGGELGDMLVSLHPSIRRKLLSIEGKTTKLLTELHVAGDVPGVFDTRKALRLLRAEYLRVKTAGPTVFADALRIKVGKLLKDFDDEIGFGIDAEGTKLATQLRTEVEAGEPLIDPKAWNKKWNDSPNGILAANPRFGRPAEVGVAAGAAAAINKQRSVLKRMVGQVAAQARKVQTTDTPLRTVEQAIEALLGGVESRAAGAELLRNEVARQYRVRAKPLSVKMSARGVTAQEDVVRAEAWVLRGLSKQGAAFADSIEEAFKIPRVQAEGVALLWDARAEAYVEAMAKAGKEYSVEKWWSDQGLEVLRAGEGALPADPDVLWQKTTTAKKRKFAVADAEAARDAVVAAATRRVLPEKELFQLAGSEPKASIQFKSGRAIITAFEKGDISSLIHETGHLFRRDLERLAAELGAGSDAAKDLMSLATWAKLDTSLSGTIKWTTEGEEMVARAFERYLYDGKAPIPELRNLFKRFADFMRKVYVRLAGSPIAGKLNPKVREVFDRMFQVDSQAAVARSQAAQGLGAAEPLSRISHAVRAGISGQAAEEPGRAALDIISRRAKVHGIDISPADLLAKLEADGKIDFVELAPADTTIAGKTLWTTSDVARMQADLDSAAEMRRARAEASRHPLVSEAEAVMPQTTVERARQAVETSKEGGKGLSAAQHAGRAGLFAIVGGNADISMTDMAATARRAINGAASRVSLAVGEFARLMNEGNYAKFIEALVGRKVNFSDGTTMKAVELNSYGRAMDRVKMHFEQLNPNVQESLRRLSQAGPVASGRKIPGKSPVEILDGTDVDALVAFLRGSLSKPAPEFLNFFDEVLEFGGRADPGAVVDITAAHRAALEMLLRHAGAVPDLELQKLDAAARARVFLDEIHELWGKELGAEKSLRLGMGMAMDAYTELARMDLIRYGLGVTDEAVFKGLASWGVGEVVDPAVADEVAAFARRVGLNPVLIKDQLLGLDVWLPAAARERIWNAVTQGVPQQTWMSKALGVDVSQVYETPFGGALASILRFVKMRLTRGGFMLRSRYFTQNTFDHFTQVALQVGFRPAIVSTARLMAQDVLLLVPGAARASWAGGKATGGRIGPEWARKLLQTGGDRLARGIAKVLRISKWRVDVNDVLDGTDKVFEIGGKVYTGKTLRDLAAKHGIFSTFHTVAYQREIRRVLDIEKGRIIRADILGEATGGITRAIEEAYDYVPDLAEAWSERERIGAFVTFMESGMVPEAAARLTVEALYDYAGSMSRADRNMLVGMIWPFWSFQKNANVQIINAMLQPRTAWRMGMLRKMTELGPQALTHVMYDTVVEPYGIDVDSLTAKGRDTYWTMRILFETGLGPRDSWEGRTVQFVESTFGPLGQIEPEMISALENGVYGSPDKVPPDAKRSMRMMLAGTRMEVEGDKPYELGATAAAGATRPSIETSPGAVPYPSGTELPTYLQDRSRFAITRSLQAGTQKYKEISPTGHVFTELLLPDSTIHAAFRHIAGFTAFGVMMVDEFARELPGMEATFGDPGDRAYTPVAALENVAEFGDAPVYRELLAAVSNDPRKLYPRKLHPVMARMIEATLSVPLVRSSAVIDPMAPAEATGGTAKREYAYLPPSWAPIFDYSPLGEMNAFLLAAELTPLEQARKAEGAISPDMLRLARMTLGVQTIEASQAGTAKLEEPVFPSETRTPPIGR